MRILVAETKDFCPQVIADLAKLGTVSIKNVPSGELSKNLEGVDILWCRLAHTLDRKLLELGKDLKIIVCPVTGLDHIDLNYAETRGIQVLSLKGEKQFLTRIRATAEHTLSLSLALLRNLPEGVKMGVQGVWERDRLRGKELFESTVGIVGLGRLGKIVSGYFAALGARVLATDTVANSVPLGVGWVKELKDLLPQCDLVSLHVDLNETSNHLMSEGNFSLMKKGSYLVNTSRGKVVDTLALIASLDSGHLAGAALDVLEGEQDGESSPVFLSARRFAQNHPRKLILTPHVGGATFESTARTESFLLKKLVEALGKGHSN